MKVSRVSVTAVSAVRIFRLRRFDIPREMATAVALSRPMSASWRPAAERVRFFISVSNRVTIMVMMISAMARMMKARKTMYGVRLS